DGHTPEIVKSSVRSCAVRASSDVCGARDCYCAATRCDLAHCVVAQVSNINISARVDRSAVRAAEPRERTPAIITAGRWETRERGYVVLRVYFSHFAICLIGYKNILCVVSANSAWVPKKGFASETISPR